MFLSPLKLSPIGHRLSSPPAIGANSRPVGAGQSARPLQPVWLNPSQCNCRLALAGRPIRRLTRCATCFLGYYSAKLRDTLDRHTVSLATGQSWRRSLFSSGSQAVCLSHPKCHTEPLRGNEKDRKRTSQDWPEETANARQDPTSQEIVGSVRTLRPSHVHSLRAPACSFRRPFAAAPCAAAADA